MIEHLLSTKSSYLSGILIDSLNSAQLPDFMLNRGTLSLLLFTWFISVHYW